MNLVERAGLPEKIILDDAILYPKDMYAVKGTGELRYEPLVLRPVQWEIIVLLSTAERALSRDEIGLYIAGDDWYERSSKLIEAHISKIRKKCGKDNIKTVTGGYEMINHEVLFR